MSDQKSIVFFHPDLGIGGAERLVIDAAVGLQNLGHKVTIYTSHRDPSHCFDEARDGMLDVRVSGNSIFPATFLGRFKILFAILRHYHLLLSITVSGELNCLQPDAFFIDQLCAGIPILRWRQPDIPILFYCHFPDLLLVQQRGTWWKRIWRIGFDWLEGWGMRGADRIIVNSGFTKGVVERVWKGIGGERGVGVVHPCVNTQDNVTREEDVNGGLWKGKKVVLSINRFERKKDIGLAIRAFAGLGERRIKGARLVIAGGYDNREQENVLYHNELVSLAESHGLQTATAKNVVTALNVPPEIDVLFLLSVPAQLKSTLLAAATLLIYTPSNEHFGIVPLEAMLAGVPVLAANSGGPLETIIDNETGWLRPVEKIEEWTTVMQQALYLMSADELQRMGEAGKERVKSEFSATKMSESLDEEFDILVNSPRVEVWELQDLLLGLGLLGIFVIAAIAAFRPR